MDTLLKLTKVLKPYSKHRFLLAVSGGLDSMALYYVFLHFKKHFGFQFSVAHFHHGCSKDADLQKFRFDAHNFIRSRCLEDGIAFESNYDGGSKKSFLTQMGAELKSEEECRGSRYQFLNNRIEQGSHDLIVLAHHQDDLLETRLLRLMRGVGPEGLKAMSLRAGHLLRPLLSLSRSELQNFMEDRDYKWIEDPSNQESHALRNWLRNHWLKDLEARQPGASKSMARSLDLLLAESAVASDLSHCFDGDGIVLAELLTLSPERKKQVIATYMKSQGLKNYGLSHVLEVLKRLDSSQKRHTFTLLGRRWTVDAGRMSQEGLD